MGRQGGERMSEPEPIGQVVNLDDARRRTIDPVPPTIVVEEPAGEVGRPPRVPPKYALTLDQLGDTPTADAVRAWVEARPTTGLLMVGPVGTGKSTAAGAIALPLGAPYRCSYWPVPDLIAAIKDEIHNPHGGHTVTQKIKNRHALVLDDIGTEHDTDWQRKVLTDLIAHVYDQELALIATTNLGPAELERSLGERTTSRLMEMCTLLPVTGNDRRRA
jgi:chromosomal replication initiation ATPase DnaA